MQIFSFSKCQTCLVKMCCQNVCEEYREHIFETRGCEIIIDPFSLRECERAIAINLEKKNFELNVQDNIVKISIDIIGIS